MQMDVIHHASIRLEEGIVLYIDPYDISEEKHDADYIFITHDHYDHYDEESIKKIKKSSTKIIVPLCLKDKGYDLVVEPNKEYVLDTLSFQTIPAYNTEASFHPKAANYVGYNILLNGLYYYIMGDTNRTHETDKVHSDICFVPIGGTYTMNVEEAVAYIDTVQPMVAIPIHYGKIVGNLSLGDEFQHKAKNSKVILMIKGE